MKQEAGQIGVLGFEIEFIVFTPVFKQSKPGGANGHMNIPIQLLLFALYIHGRFIIIDKAL